MTGTDPHQLVARIPQPWYRLLYVPVLIAIAIGILVGHLARSTGAAMKPLGDALVALIKMMIAPVIFCTVLHGIATIGDLKRFGRVGIKALIYFSRWEGELDWRQLAATLSTRVLAGDPVEADLAGAMPLAAREN